MSAYMKKKELSIKIQYSNEVISPLLVLIQIQSGWWCTVVSEFYKCKCIMAKNTMPKMRLKTYLS